MSKPNHLPATVPPSGGALTTTPGTQRIATRMADDLLAVARLSRERALAAQRRYRIGKYEFREADHEQIQRWARMLGMGPEAVVNRLSWFPEPSYSYRLSAGESPVNFHIHDGHILSLIWDFDKLPLTDWAWVDGLKIEQLEIRNYKKVRLPTLPRSLRGLFYKKCLMAEIDLTPVSGLIELHCLNDQLTELDLTPVPGLKTLEIEHDSGYIDLDIDLNPVPELTTLIVRFMSQFDLTPVPGLKILNFSYMNETDFDLTRVPGLTELHCSNNQLNKLDLTPVPGLTELDCSWNQLSALDLTPVPGLTTLYCGGNHWLTNLDLSPVPGLKTLVCHTSKKLDFDLTRVPGLTELHCSDNQLNKLDLTPLPGLTELDCSLNQLNKLDLTPVPGLTYLNCTNNSLHKLDLTPVPGLTSLNCDPGVRLTGTPRNLEVTHHNRSRFFNN